MTEDGGPLFPRLFLDEMKPIALDRIKGGLLRRIYRLWGGRVVVGDRRTYSTIGCDDGLKFSRRSYFSAIHLAGQRMTPRERSAWLEDGTLPDGFWEWVDDEAASWDSLPC